MNKNQIVKDIMVDVFDFPHVPYWFTIRQAIEIMKRASAGAGKGETTNTILVFDEKYNYMGMIRQRDVIAGLEPSLLKKSEWTGPGMEVSRDAKHVSEEHLAMIADNMFKETAKKEAEKQVREIMVAVNVFVAPQDSPAKAAYLMSRHEVPFLAVLENRQKLVGMISMSAVFNWVAGIVVE